MCGHSLNQFGAIQMQNYHHKLLKARELPSPCKEGCSPHTAVIKSVLAAIVSMTFEKGNFFAKKWEKLMLCFHSH